MPTATANYTTHPDYLGFLTQILTEPAEDTHRTIER